MVSDTCKARSFLLSYLVLSIAAVVSEGSQQQKPKQEQHPDLQGLLLLKATICGDPSSCLPSWVLSPPKASPCGAFEGVECRGAGGRVLSVDVRLHAASVAFGDAGLPPAANGSWPGVLDLLLELTLVCQSDATAKANGGPPAAAAAASGASEAGTLAAAAAAVQAAASGDVGGRGALPRVWPDLLPSLRHLRVDGCGADGALPWRLVDGGSLLTLALPRNQLSEWPTEVPHRMSLELLDLSHNRLGPGPPPGNWSGPRLRYLYLQGNPGLWPRGSFLPPEWPPAFPALVLSDLSPPPGMPRPAAPRGWLREFCGREGAFVCLQGSSGGGAGCARYIYGSSDRHWDYLNECDNPGQAPGVLLAWLLFLGVLALMVLHHRSEMAAMEPPSASWRPRVAGQGGGSGLWTSASAPAAPGHPWVSPFADYAGGGGGGGFTPPLKGSSAGGSGGGGGWARIGRDGLTAPLLAPDPANAAPAGSGGSGGSGASTSGGGGTPWGTAAGIPAAGGGRCDSGHLLPSALSFQTPPRWGQGDAAAAAMAARPGHRADGEATPYLGSAGGAAAAAQAPRPVPGRGPWPDPSPSFFQLLLPLAALTANAVANGRMLALWGLRPPGPHLAPSYVLLVLLLLPSAAAAAIELLRAVATAAALPPALRSASAASPPEWVATLLCSWVMGAPWWAAYPCLLLLLGPCLVLLSVLLPLTLPLYLVGLSTHQAALRYVELLQACSAATLAPGSAALLTGLLLSGNTPMTAGVLVTPSLYWVVLPCAFADAAAALHLALLRARRERLQQARLRRGAAAALEA